MDDLKTALVIEYQRLDLEYEVIRGIVSELKQKGKICEADDVEQALQHVCKAILLIKKSWKFLPDKPAGEQIKMDLGLD